MRLRRTLTAVALAAVAMGVLSACQTKVGLAASVSGQRLTDGDLAGYVDKGTTPYSEADQSGAKVTVVPKILALQTWLKSAVVAHAVTAHGGPPSAAELSTARTVVLSGQSLGAVEKSYISRGYSRSLADLAVDSTADIVILVERIAKGTTAAQAYSALGAGKITNAELVSAIIAAKPDVLVSSRYGTWSPKTLSLSAGPKTGLPGFVTFTPTGKRSGLTHAG